MLRILPNFPIILKIYKALDVSMRHSIRDTKDGTKYQFNLAEAKRDKPGLSCTDLPNWGHQNHTHLMMISALCRLNVPV